MQLLLHTPGMFAVILALVLQQPVCTHLVQVLQNSPPYTIMNIQSITCECVMVNKVLYNVDSAISRTYITHVMIIRAHMSVSVIQVPLCSSWCALLYSIIIA